MLGEIGPSTENEYVRGAWHKNVDRDRLINRKWVHARSVAQEC